MDGVNIENAGAIFDDTLTQKQQRERMLPLFI